MDFIKRFWQVGLAVLLIGAFLIHFRGCNWNPFYFGPQEFKGVTGTVETTANNVKLTPKATKANPKPTPENIWKPKEGTVSVTPNQDGTANVKIQRTGFCFEPKLGAGFDGTLYPLGGLRFFFHERFGLEVLGSEKYAHLGADFRVGNLSLSAGAKQPYAKITDLSVIGAYVAMTVFVK